MNKSVINSYRLNPTPPPSGGIIAGRIVPVAAPPDYRRAVVVLAALVLPLLAIGVVVYAVRTVQPAPVAGATALPVATERVIDPSPVVIIVTAAPPAPVQPARQAAPPQPVQRAPVVSQPAPQSLPTVGRPTARPTVRPTAPPPVTGGPVRAAGVSAAPAAVAAPDPHTALFQRDCVYPSAPQGTVLQGYYTDERGVKRDAVCKPDGWKAAD